MESISKSAVVRLIQNAEYEASHAMGSVYPGSVGLEIHILKSVSGDTLCTFNVWELLGGIRTLSIWASGKEKGDWARAHTHAYTPTQKFCCYQMFHIGRSSYPNGRNIGYTFEQLFFRICEKQFKLFVITTITQNTLYQSTLLLSQYFSKYT